MSLFPRRGRVPVGAWLAVMLAALLGPSTLLADFASAQCVETDTALRFEYRLEPEAEVARVAVTQNGQPLEARHTAFANNPQTPGAILVMVDTSAGSSHAPRDHTLAHNKTLIQELMAKTQPQNLIGVCGFANDLAEIAPLARPDPEIRAKLANLKADGLGTRIYRQGIRGVKLLAATPATRKTLLILSDGKDEDNGFTREDLVKSANAHGVMICAMGCPETGMDVPALGNLEKLANETHGLYAQAKIGEGKPGERFQADAKFVHDVLDLVNSGGEITVPRDQLAPAGDLLFILKTTAGETFTYLQPRAGAAQTPAPAASTGETATAAASPTPSAQPTTAVPATATPAARPTVTKPTPRPTPRLQQDPQMGRYISIGSIILLAAAVLFLRYRSRPSRHKTGPEMAAFLQMQDAESRRIPLTGIATRIGRRPDNDVVFSNTSVSGYHAEIHRQRDGAYLITDLGSGNGLAINGHHVTQAMLKEGDLVEIGEVRFRFHLAPSTPKPGTVN